MKRLGAVALVLVLAAACNKSNSTAPTTTPTAPITTETFTGTVPVGGSDSHTFTVSATGAVNFTLTAAGPPSGIYMGLGIGTPKDSTCALLPGASTTAQAAATPQLSGTTTAGTLCAEVHDVGNQTAPVTYTVTVSHP